MGTEGQGKAAASNQRGQDSHYDWDSGRGQCIWHYRNSDGEEAGPLNEYEILAMINSGSIPRDTPIRRDSMADWTTAAQCELSAGLIAEVPAPTTPPNDVPAWIIAFVPLIGVVIEENIAANMPMSPWITMLLYAISYVALTAFDTNALYSGGHLRDKSLLVTVIFVPLYLFRRARLLGQSLAYFWVWVATFVGALLITNPALLTGSLYFGSGLPGCNSSYAKTQVARIFNDIPQMKLSALNAIDIVNISDTGSTDALQRCSATVNTSDGGRKVITFTITKSNDTLYLRVQLAQ